MLVFQQSTMGKCPNQTQKCLAPGPQQILIHGK